MRTCAWCETDISAPGAAFPIMHARWGGPDDNWQCSDTGGCERRQDRLLAQAGGNPAPYGHRPTAALLSKRQED